MISSKSQCLDVLAVCSNF
uniref:Uncharacterized protein n=1 Tax=Arundo donax TaxID=35708 RepID=A0A0A9B448_ARUDO